MAEQAITGRTVWLESERWEGLAKEAGRPADEVNVGRSQSLHSTDAPMRCEKRGKQSRAEGEEAGRWKREGHGQAERKRSAGSAE